MTGPEHYREAERLVDVYQRQTGTATAETISAQLEAGVAMMAAAQVHATLALAAAAGGQRWVAS